MILKNILIAGLARNCQKTLLSEIKRLKKSFELTCSIKWLIIESDSSDATLFKLAKIKSQLPDFDYISLGTLEKNLTERTDRLAHCRNIYLDELKNNPKYLNVEYLVVADLDGVNGLISSKAIESCWNSVDQWDVCTANQKHAYYDIWALRHPHLSPNDCVAHRDFLMELGLSMFKSECAAILSKIIEIPYSSKWIEVESAFGGLAIYKKNVLNRAKYSGRDKNNKVICEHVPLNLAIIQENKKIYINPKLINGGYNSHSFRTLIFSKIIRSAWYFLNHT
jgi:hypothetical protein